MAYYIVVSNECFGTLPILKNNFKDIKTPNIIFTSYTEANEYKEQLKKEHNFNNRNSTLISVDNLEFIICEYYLKQ